MSDLTVVFGCIVDKSDVEKTRQSLTFFRFLQSILYLKELFLLLMAAHYTSAIQILRYRLESMVQAVYLDQQHPNMSLSNKLCILEEISDKREYFTTRLVNMISDGHKKTVKEAYRALSQRTHPSHVDFPTVEELMASLKDAESSINCGEFDGAVDLIVRTYDMIFFLDIQIFKEAKEAVKSNPDVKEVIEKHRLSLLHKIL